MCVLEERLQQSRTLASLCVHRGTDGAVHQLSKWRKEETKKKAIFLKNKIEKESNTQKKDQR